MVDALFTLRGSKLPADAVLVGFRGREELSRPYRFELYVTAQRGGELEDMLSTTASLVFRRPSERSIHGVVRGVEVLEEQSSRAVARLVLVPRWQLLSLSRHSRLFTSKKVPDILEQVLKDAGLTSSDYELRLDGDYQEQAHVCQYGESDLSFVSRWMEHEGIYYFFEHGDDGEKLVLRDGPVDVSLGEGRVRYRGGGGDDHSHGDALHSFRSRHVARPKSVRLSDYDYAQPSLDVSGTADAFAHGVAEVVVDADDRFFTAARGKALAGVRAEALMASQAVFRGRGRVLELQPGFCFDLEEHPLARFDARYLCTRAEHVGVTGGISAELARMTELPAEETYTVDIEAIAASRAFRPERRTPKPRVHGYAIAVVDGPADSEYAQIDEQGRYHVIFNMDESDLADGNASTWLRMMQPHAGAPEGMHFPLRKGTEVMVAFLDGDPDRPLIAGAVDNPVNPSPVTSANNTKNVIHTGGNTRIEMEDQDGSQWIHISTPTEATHMHLGLPHDAATHHLELKTDGDALFSIGSNQDIFVGGKLTETVTGAVKETYKSSQTSTVTGPKKTTVTKDGTVETYKSTQLTYVSGNVKETYNAGQETTVDAAKRSEFFDSTQTTTVNAAVVEQQFHDKHMRGVTGDTRHVLTGTLTRHVTGAATMNYGAGIERKWGPTKRKTKSLDWTVTGDVTIVCGHQNLADPDGFWSHFAAHKFVGTGGEVALLILAGYLEKYLVTGAYFSFINAKLENMGLHLGATGFLTGSHGGHTKINGVLWHIPKGVTGET